VPGEFVEYTGLKEQAWLFANQARVAAGVEIADIGFGE
jgi:hypothetical protein